MSVGGVFLKSLIKAGTAKGFCLSSSFCKYHSHACTPPSNERTGPLAYVCHDSELSLLSVAGYISI